VDGKATYQAESWTREGTTSAAATCSENFVSGLCSAASKITCEWATIRELSHWFESK
jgi:hypothetical protein